MKKRAMRKDFFMEIKKSFARFISIFFIVAMGVAFFSGIQSASPDMRYTGDSYYDAQKLMDLKVVGTLGLNQENIEALEELPGIVLAEGGYGLDVLCSTQKKETVVHLESLTPVMNQVTVNQGRLPKKKGECFLDEVFAKENGYRVGDTILFDSGEEKEEEEEEENGTIEKEEPLLQVTRYRIVGVGHSPLYISFSRGNTNLGSGEVGGFAYVTEDNFHTDYYTQAYLQAKGALNLTSYTDLYDNLIEKVTGQVEGLEEEQCQVRYDQVRGDAEGQIREAQAELDEGKAQAEEELAEAFKELEDGEQELADGRAELEEGRNQLAAAKRELENGRNQLAQAKKQVQDGEAALKEARAQVEQGERELAAAKTSLDAGQAEADAGKAQLDEGRARLDEGKAQLAAQEAKLKDGLAQLEAQAAQLDGAQAEVDAARLLYDQAVSSGQVPPEQLEAMLAEIEASQAKIDAGRGALEEARAQLEAGRPALEEAKTELARQEEAFEASLAEWEAGSQKLQEGWAAYNASAQKAASGRKQMEDSAAALAAGRSEIASNEKKLLDGQAEIAQNEAKLADAETEIAKGEAELADGRKEYEEGKAEAEAEIADGERKIADAWEQVEEIEQPQWMITDRDDLPEYADYGSNADRIRNIGRVFPVMFFLVAALISLTTMTRMVEEQRTQIGTLKALGYSKFSIISKYLNYAFLATVGGSILGVLIGQKILPYIIIKAYGIMYHNMDAHIYLGYEPSYALIASVAAVICTIGATLSSCYKELAETPASLMRPPAPKEGKRVLLERVTFLWKRLSFTWKSTLRNLIRYKKRFFMTVFGIGGCMALLLVGYGIRDSIMDIGALQYEELQIYDAMIIGDEDAASKEKAALYDFLEKEKKENIESFTPVMFQSMSAKKGKVNISPYLYVVEKGSDLDGNVVLRDRKTHEQFALEDEGAAISEKTASLLELQVGDSLLLEADGEEVSIPVSVITENYMGHYVYLTDRLYRESFQETPKYQDVLITMKEDAKLSLEEMGQEILEHPAALSISYSSSIAGQLDRMLSSLDTVIVVLIISAGMLAFVVLYNLNNINITERKRELATLKVLGFYDKEVSQYVFRENILLTIVGVGAGILMGIVLHRFVIVTVEVDAAMFGRSIYLPSFLISAAFTCGFSLFVNGMMYFKLKKIDMVESLKSVE